MKSRVDNVWDVIQVIRDYEREHKGEFRFQQSSWEKWLFWISIVFPILGLLLISICFFIPNREIFLFALLLMLISYISGVILFVILFSKFLKPDTYLDRIQRAVKAETGIIEILSNTELHILEQAMERFDYEVSSTEYRITSLFSMFNQMGIVPVALAIYIAYEKKDILQTYPIFGYIGCVILFVFSVYIFGSAMRRSHVEVGRRYSFLIKSAKGRAEFRNTLQNPS